MTVLANGTESRLQPGMQDKESLAIAQSLLALSSITKESHEKENQHCAMKCPKGLESPTGFEEMWYFAQQMSSYELPENADLSIKQTNKQALANTDVLNLTNATLPISSQVRLELSAVKEQKRPYIGKYSPRSRKLRIKKFLEKRLRRVWVKKVDYDVRKHFADSRLRVKGRFVKKEHEELLYELVALT